MNPIISSRRIRKCFQPRLSRRRWQLRLALSEQSELRRCRSYRFGARHNSISFDHEHEQDHRFFHLCQQLKWSNVRDWDYALNNEPESSNSQDRIGVIDMIAHDPKRDETVLVMDESQPWDDSDERLHELQERFNAYVSFLLDGEFAEWNPKLAQKPVRIEVRCAHMPGPRAIDLLGKIHDQLAHQEIKMEVIVKDGQSSPSTSKTK